MVSRDHHSLSDLAASPSAWAFSGYLGVAYVSGRSEPWVRNRAQCRGGT